MRITTKLLREHGACTKGIQWFEERYPDGYSLDDLDTAPPKDCPTKFVWWVYNNITQDNPQDGHEDES
ncbi:hypothetical protein LJC34_05525 [Oscillospiraceae bacterium OttesenSCG-928-G22]|nr:hypothetical protein [Oscillospiraceae bacterium OttesenSCG-928-G22]